MNIDKAKLQKELDSLLMKKKIFLIISISLFAVSLILAIIFIIMVVQKSISDNTSVLLSVLSDVTFCAAIVILVLRSVLFTYQINVRKAILSGQVQIMDATQGDPHIVPITDVKEAPQAGPMKTKEQELVDQYEELYKKGYISKEDFEAKKKEILN